MNILRQLGVLCACLVPLLYCQNSQAITVYTYTGNAFDNTDLSQCAAPGCFNITAVIEVSTALAPNLALGSITPDAWSISDGVSTITDQTADYHAFWINVGTGSDGNINQWDFVIGNDLGIAYGLDDVASIETRSGSSARDRTGYCTSGTPTSCSNTTYAELLDSTGSWTMTTVPLPAAVWLFGTGLLGLIGIGRKRRPT